MNFRSISLYLTFILMLEAVTCQDEGDTFFGHFQDNINNEIKQCDGEDCLGSPDSDVAQSHQEINVIITFTNAKNNRNLQRKFTVTVTSLFQHASVPLAMHIIGEEDSQQIAQDIIRSNAGEANYRVVELDVDKLARELDEIVRPMQHHFSYKPGAYYNHALFFLSIAIHRVMPLDMHRVIMLDADLKFTDDISKLHEHFSRFSATQVMGIANEMQPVYRHAFWEFRRDNHGTRVGEPAPTGLPGFNSGVLLLDLDAMRQSELYNSLLTEEAVSNLTREFHFKGHLGDQDLFTLIGMKYEGLFHVLPCQWNRQLCTWWYRQGGYSELQSQYHACDGDIKIWHGNCDTPIP